MRKWLFVIGIIAILLIGGYLTLSFFAVKLIQPQLQKVLGPGFTIAEIKVKLTYLSVKGIQYEGFHTKKRYLQIKEARIFPALLSLLKGSLRIREFIILQPSFYFSRSREGVFVGPWTAIQEKEKEREIRDDREEKGREPFLRIDRVRIRKGSVDFEDKKVGGPPAQIKLRELDLEIKDIQYPIVSNRSPIELKGKVEGRMKEGNADLKGWIDLKTMDMETSFKVREIDLKIFEPYYQKRVSAEIDSGYIHMDTKITMKEKRIDAPGQLDLVNLHIKEGGGTVLWIPATALISLLKDKGNRIQIQFHVKGSLDDPKFSLQEAFLTRIAVSLAEALGVPIKIVGEEVLKGTIKGEKGLVEGLKTIEELLKKKKEKKK